MDCFNYSCPFRVNETSNTNRCECVACQNRSSNDFIITSNRILTDDELAMLAALRSEDTPTVDAVEVVRCRNCKNAWIHPCGYVYCHRDGRNAYEMTFNLDGFCSYGERKEGTNND